MSTAEQRAAAEKVAIAGAIKESELTGLKRSLPEGESIAVEVVARVKGVVQIGKSIPGSSGTRGATPVNLLTPDIITETLRRLKVSPAKLRQVLKAIAKAGHDKSYLTNDDNAAIATVFRDAQDKITSELPPVPYTSAGRAAPVSVAIESFQIIESPASNRRAA